MKKIPLHLRATLADYKGSGFDRGHMTPAANHRSTFDIMENTFFLTNICPRVLHSIEVMGLNWRDIYEI
ncbi:DNA/RNA non-specific endonuclease [Candidatus Protochlamydia amoebophila]|uniref:Endonuclease n=1 Tax=Protochlamydia amoebophila (strain UWE25) TaxID=264201 RepID=A0A2P9HAF3_PARUW|nr:unnamed protein product [Candidatus Protochlamydia amoebophila UWE25]